MGAETMSLTLTVVYSAQCFPKLLEHKTNLDSQYKILSSSTKDLW